MKTDVYSQVNYRNPFAQHTDKKMRIAGSIALYISRETLSPIIDSKPAAKTTPKPGWVKMERLISRLTNASAETLVNDVLNDAVIYRPFVSSEDIAANKRKAAEFLELNSAK